MACPGGPGVACGLSFSPGSPSLLHWKCCAPGLQHWLLGLFIHSFPNSILYTFGTYLLSASSVPGSLPVLEVPQ